jgi:hypothetical protein
MLVVSASQGACIENIASLGTLPLIDGSKGGIRPLDHLVPDSVTSNFITTLLRFSFAT